MINLFKSLIGWLAIVLTHKVCCADHFISVCNKAIAYAEKDEDGMISVSELIMFIITSFRR